MQSSVFAKASTCSVSLTLGVLTGVGGGILRDLLLDIAPPHSIQHWPNITVALIAVAIATPSPTS